MMLMSSRMAACGQPPVSTARMRWGGRAPLLTKKSPSSWVKMSFVTCAVTAAQPSGQGAHSATFCHILPHSATFCHILPHSISLPFRHSAGLTAPKLYLSRSARHSASMRAVFLQGSPSDHHLTSEGRVTLIARVHDIGTGGSYSAYPVPTGPPIPIVNARSSKSRPAAFPRGGAR